MYFSCIQSINQCRCTTILAPRATEEIISETADRTKKLRSDGYNLVNIVDCFVGFKTLSKQV